MEKSITFSSSESSQSQQIEQERTQILAQIGTLMMDLETAKKLLDSATERRNAFVRQIVSSAGIYRFDSVRPVKDGLIVTVPDDSSKFRPNGGITDVDVTR